MLTTNQILHQGRYRIISQLGQNGIGFGYEAFDSVLEANVLLKEIRENLGKVTTSAQLEARKLAFADEATRLTGIKHESLLQVQDFFSEIDRHYLVTEYIDGNTLGELLEEKNSPFPLADVGNWADRLLDALNYLHTLTPPIFHRQIKPSNVRLSSNGKTKLLVVGIAKSAGNKAAINGANQTLDAAVLPYLPLEQIWDGLDAASQKVILTNYDEKSEKILEQPIDARSDIYALAATLYQLLTARIPIDALTRSIDIFEGKSDPLQSPNQLNPSVPREISDVLMKALEIKRENRFSSSVIMRQVLRTAFVRVKEREAKEVKQVKPETVTQVKPETVTQVKPETVTQVKPETVTQVKPETIAQVKPEEVKQIKQEDEAVLEIPLMQPNPVASPRPPVVVQKSLEIEAEQARQLNFIKQQLREAEERRLEAEQRAAAAEKRLLEKEAEKPVAVEPLAIEAETEKPVIAEPVAIEAEFVKGFTPEPPAEIISEPKAEAIAPEYSSNEYSDLFAEPPKANNLFKKVAAAAVVLIVLGGAAFGIWTFLSSKTADTNQTVSASNTATPAPTVESTPAQTVEAAPVSSYQTTSDINTTPTVSTQETNTSSNPTAVKTKTATAPTPAQAKKPTATTAKTPEVKKKVVTLDDLLKDN